MFIAQSTMLFSFNKSPPAIIQFGWLWWFQLVPGDSPLFQTTAGGGSLAQQRYWPLWKQEGTPLLYFGGNICLPVSTCVNSLHCSGRDHREFGTSLSGTADVTTHSAEMRWCGFSVNIWEMLFGRQTFVVKTKTWHKPSQKWDKMPRSELVNVSVGYAELYPLTSLHPQLWVSLFLLSWEWILKPDVFNR